MVHGFRYEMIAAGATDTELDLCVPVYRGTDNRRGFAICRSGKDQSESARNAQRPDGRP